MVATLALSLACTCGPGAPNPPGECPAATPGASIDRLEVTASYSSGIQGTAMVALSPRWFGSEAPACADLRWSVMNEAGTQIYSGDAIVQTELRADGARTPNGLIFREASPQCGHTFRFESHGEVVTGDVEVAFNDCDPDAGPPDGGSRDAGWPFPDTGPTDSGIDSGPDSGPIDSGPDAGPFDSGPDAGPFDSGPFDAGSDGGPIDAAPSDSGPLDSGGDAG